MADIAPARPASDRRYKRAVPVVLAHDILSEEVRRGALDAELLDVFIQRKVYELATPSDEPSQSSLVIAR